MSNKKMTMREAAELIYKEAEDAGEEFDLGKLLVRLKEMHLRGEIHDDPVDDRARYALKTVDRQAQQEGQRVFEFAMGDFPSVLVTGKSVRQPTQTAVLRHVMADQAVKEDNAIAVAESMQQLRRKNLAILPYLEEGMSVPEAVDAWISDHKTRESEEI